MVLASDPRWAQAIIAATAVAGTLDIADAVIVTWLTGKSPVRMLQGIASGWMGRRAMAGGAGSAAIRVLTHFAIMLVMVAAFVLAAGAVPVLTQRPWLFGPLYGLVLYGVMYFVVLPWRFPGPRQWDAVSVINQLLAHTLLVGLAMALTVRAVLGREAL